MNGELILDKFVADPILGLSIVAPSDYDFSGGATEPSGAVLKRIRGSLSLYHTAVANAGEAPESLVVAIIAHDKDEPIVSGGLDPTLLNVIIDSEVLWLRDYVFGPVTVGTAFQKEAWQHIEIDCKAQRRLKDTAVSLILSVRQAAARADAIVGTFTIRSLLAMKASG